MSKTTYIYLQSLDLYLCSDGKLYNDEQLDYFYNEEKEWKKNLPNPTFQELMKMFPKSIASARRGQKAEIKRQKQLMSDSDEAREEYYNDVINKADFREQNKLKKEIDEYFDKLRKKRESKIKACVYNLSYLDQLQGKEVKKLGGITDRDIERAKKVPIESLYIGDLLKHGKRAIGICPFHKEKTSSFTAYLDQNSWWCYGCNSGGSVVDFVMKQNDIDFLSAVKHLIK